MNRLKWRLAKGTRALLSPCSVCGSKQRVEMHHVRRLKNIERRVSAISPLYTHIISMKRKKIPLCYKCNREAHRLGYNKIFSIEGLRQMRQENKKDNLNDLTKN